MLLTAALGSSCSILNPSSSDQAALDSLLEAGSDLNKVHPFDFYLYHPEQSGAQQMCTHLREQGFQVTVKEGAVQGEWLCLATLNFVPSLKKLSELQAVFDDLVDQYGGEYDGWETIVIP
jgi:regulator of RNase E activity RraB